MTKEYLEQTHWGKQAVEETAEEQEEKETNKLLTLTYLQLEKGIFDGVIFKQGRITKQEFERAIWRLKRGKTPGPDNITSDFVEDLNNDQKEYLLATLNKYWEEGIPDDLTLARIYSLYKKGTQISKKTTDPSAYLIHSTN